MNSARLLPVFSTVFVFCYGICVFFNLALFTYLPAAHQFAWFVPAFVKGPHEYPMFWYGWLSTTLIATALITAAIALVPPPKSKAPAALLWIAPFFAFGCVIWVLKMWFLM